MDYKIKPDYYNTDYFSKYSVDVNKRLDKLVDNIVLKDAYSVLDVACGGGVLASMISNRIRYYWGVDYSEASIAFADSHFRADNVMFVCQDIRLFCLEHLSCFDVVCAFDFCEHITDEEFLGIFVSINRSMKKGSLLYIHTPNGLYFLEILKKIGIMKQFPEHIAVRTGGQYVNLLEKTGFKVVELLDLPHYLSPMSWFHFLSKIPFIGKVFAARLFITCCCDDD